MRRSARIFTVGGEGGHLFVDEDRLHTTVGFFSFVVAGKDLPEDLVYAIVKAFCANHERKVQAQASARESVVANLNRNTFIPYHPGAARYYREIEVEIPAALASAQ